MDGGRVFAVVWAVLALVMGVSLIVLRHRVSGAPGSQRPHVGLPGRRWSPLLLTSIGGGFALVGSLVLAVQMLHPT